MNGELVTVRFRGAVRDAQVAPRSTVVAAAREAGTEIAAACGGRGRCRSCRVKLVRGSPPPATLADIVQLGDEEIAEGYRLGCQWRVSADVEVQIAAPAAETAFQILTATDGSGGEGLRIDCGVDKRHVHPRNEAPLADAGSGIEAVLDGPVDHAGEPISLTTLRGLGAALRDPGAGITVVSFAGVPIAFEPGDTTGEAYGVALDVGTTTVVVYLIDLRTAETVAVESGLNPQSVHGGDLISRIGHATKGEEQLRELRSLIVRFANELIAAACARTGISSDRVYKVVAVGNTCMHHLLLGVDPGGLGRAPFRAVLRHGYRCRARDAGLRVNAGAVLLALPLVAGFVGADAVAMMLSTHIDRGSGVRVAIDVGTNAEVVLAAGDRLIACSAPAGPALEGGQIRSGMRAALGAIDRVTLDGDLQVRTIGDAPPRGICGSGLIDAAAVLLDGGVIAPSGRVSPTPDPVVDPRLRERVRLDGDGRPEVVLAAASVDGVESDVTLSQADVRELQLAKAAIRCALDALIDAAGVRVGDVSELMLAGGFGNYLDLGSARRIGMFPELPPENVRYVGNAAGLGARIALVSESERLAAEALARRVEHVSLAEDREFQRRYLAAIPFPES